VYRIVLYLVVVLCLSGSGWVRGRVEGVKINYLSGQVIIFPSDFSLRWGFGGGPQGWGCRVGPQSWGWGCGVWPQWGDGQGGNSGEFWWGKTDRVDSRFVGAFFPRIFYYGGGG